MVFPMADSKERPARERLKAVNFGRLTERQDSALDKLTRKLSRERGTPVTRADASREALAEYTRKQGEEWPE